MPARDAVCLCDGHRSWRWYESVEERLDLLVGLYGFQIDL
jgi:hypothetical protein